MQVPATKDSAAQQITNLNSNGNYTRAADSGSATITLFGQGETITADKYNLGDYTEGTAGNVMDRVYGEDLDVQDSRTLAKELLLANEGNEEFVNAVRDSYSTFLEAMKSEATSEYPSAQEIELADIPADVILMAEVPDTVAKNLTYPDYTELTGSYGSELSDSVDLKPENENGEADDAIDGDDLANGAPLDSAIITRYGLDDLVSEYNLTDAARNFEGSVLQEHIYSEIARDPENAAIFNELSENATVDDIRDCINQALEKNNSLHLPNISFDVQGISGDTSGNGNTIDEALREALNARSEDYKTGYLAIQDENLQLTDVDHSGVINGMDILASVEYNGMSLAQAINNDPYNPDLRALGESALLQIAQNNPDYFKAAGILDNDGQLIQPENGSSILQKQMSINDGDIIKLQPIKYYISGADGTPTSQPTVPDTPVVTEPPAETDPPVETVPPTECSDYNDVEVTTVSTEPVSEFKDEPTTPIQTETPAETVTEPLATEPQVTEPLATEPLATEPQVADTPCNPEGNTTSSGSDIDVYEEKYITVTPTE